MTLNLLKKVFAVGVLLAANQFSYSNDLNAFEEREQQEMRLRPEKQYPTNRFRANMFDDFDITPMMDPPDDTPIEDYYGVLIVLGVAAALIATQQKNLSKTSTR